MSAVIQFLSGSEFLMEVDGTILIANETTASRLGKQASTLVGAYIYDFLPMDIAPSCQGGVAKAVREWQAVYFKDVHGDLCLANSIYAITDDDGQVRQLAIIAQDITEPQKMERSLRRSQERFRALAEFTWEYWVDASQYYAYISLSCERITGYGPDRGGY